LLEEFEEVFPEYILSGLSPIKKNKTSNWSRTCSCDF
jgi:hypothetical protein